MLRVTHVICAETHLNPALLGMFLELSQVLVISRNAVPKQLGTIGPLHELYGVSLGSLSTASEALLPLAPLIFSFNFQICNAVWITVISILSRTEF